jgi:ABC-type branched-subunit amino acid transport system ATPase component
LDRDERVTLSSCLRDVVSDGCSVILVDHDLGLVADLCQRVLVLDGGRVLADGSPADVRRDERVVEAYVGRRS